MSILPRFEAYQQEYYSDQQHPRQVDEKEYNFCSTEQLPSPNSENFTENSSFFEQSPSNFLIVENFEELPPRKTSSKVVFVDGKKRYQCVVENCHKTFTTSGHVARHARVHTQLKPFSCPIPGCKSLFARQDNMKQHHRSHLKRLQVPSGGAIPYEQPKARAKLPSKISTIKPEIPNTPSPPISAPVNSPPESLSFFSSLLKSPNYTSQFPERSFLSAPILKEATDSFNFEDFNEQTAIPSKYSNNSYNVNYHNNSNDLRSRTPILPQPGFSHQELSPIFQTTSPTAYQTNTSIAYQSTSPTPYQQQHSPLTQPFNSQQPSPSMEPWSPKPNQNLWQTSVSETLCSLPLLHNVSDAIGSMPPSFAPITTSLKGFSGNGMLPPSPIMTPRGVFGNNVGYSSMPSSPNGGGFPKMEHPHPSQISSHSSISAFFTDIHRS